jgi:hypothetical protein
MSVLARSASRHYPISDAWLATEDDAPNYVDFREIIEKNSAYVDWVIANDPNCPITQSGLSLQKNRDLHAMACNFEMNGIRIGEASRGPDVVGRLLGDTFTDKGKYAGGIDHPERYGRIYRQRGWQNNNGTFARHVWWVGYTPNQ